MTSILTIRDSLINKLDADFIEENISKNINLYYARHDIAHSIAEFTKIVTDNFNATVYQYSEVGVYFYSEEFYVQLYRNSYTVTASIRATREAMDKLLSLITIVPTHSSINWYFKKSNDGYSLSTYPLKLKYQPIDEMYPFIENGMVNYFDSYIKSSASILLLIGPPGTGKTSFIRGLLKHAGKDAMMTYDEALLKNDEFFIQFINDNSSFLIVEDADTMIRPRDEGNALVSRFLNISDGVMDIKDKKIIFTTNLDSIDKIDPALTREGRCHDVLHFRHLQYNEAVALAKKCDIPFSTTSKTDSYAISEIFNKKRHNEVKSRAGFL
jgi:hypothetical protein